MICCDYELNCGWKVRVYYAVSCYWSDEILDDLIRVGCKGKNLRMAKQNLWGCQLNTGLTYSSYEDGRTVMVIGLASSAKQYQNSIAHEQLHVVQHICKALDIELDSETACYLMGELAEKMHDEAHYLTCCGCHK